MDDDGDLRGLFEAALILLPENQLICRSDFTLNDAAAATQILHPKMDRWRRDLPQDAAHGSVSGTHCGAKWDGFVDADLIAVTDAWFTLTASWISDHLSYAATLGRCHYLPDPQRPQHSLSRLRNSYLRSLVAAGTRSCHDLHCLLQPSGEAERPIDTSDPPTFSSAVTPAQLHMDLQRVERSLIHALTSSSSTRNLSSHQQETDLLHLKAVLARVRLVGVCEHCAARLTMMRAEMESVDGLTSQTRC